MLISCYAHKREIYVRAGFLLKKLGDSVVLNMNNRHCIATIIWLSILVRFYFFNAHKNLIRIINNLNNYEYMIRCFFFNSMCK